MPTRPCPWASIAEVADDLKVRDEVPARVPLEVWQVVGKAGRAETPDRYRAARHDRDRHPNLRDLRFVWPRRKLRF